MLLARTNSNSNKYYTFTYLETEAAAGQDFDTGLAREVDRARGKTFSPVKIYIET